ncbi:MAG: hypothetical protein DRJ50_14990, partial [Actinobacteria bacterium]
MPDTEYSLRFVSGGLTADAGTYGMDVGYGETGVTYGQKEGESVISGVRYAMVPVPGGSPNVAGWFYRQQDVAREFEAIVVSIDEPNVRITVDSIVRAELVMRQVTYGRTQ